MISPDDSHFYDELYSVQSATKQILSSANLFAFSVSSIYSSAFALNHDEDFGQGNSKRLRTFSKISRPKSPCYSERNSGEVSQSSFIDDAQFEYSSENSNDTSDKSSISFIDNILSDCGEDGSFSLQHIYSKALQMAKDKIGCRILQKKVLEKNPYTIRVIFDQISVYLCELMEDQFGNYLFQKIIKACDESVLADILTIVSPHLPQVSKSKHGTRSVQKLIAAISHNHLFVGIIVKSLRTHVFQLAQDLNGNHVIQKCLKTFESAKNQIIFEEINNKLVDIAMHKHGCCVLQRCIDAASPYQLNVLINSIINSSILLVQDAYGNYVVQYVINLGQTNINSKLALVFLEKIQELSSQKYSSNVIEKCLQINNSETQQLMIQEIAKSTNLEKMIFDQYANYGIFYLVVQRALTLAEPLLLKFMLHEIKMLMEKLKHSRYGRRICSKLIESHPELTSSKFKRVS